MAINKKDLDVFCEAHYKISVDYALGLSSAASKVRMQNSLKEEFLHKNLPVWKRFLIGYKDVLRRLKDGLL